MFKTTTLADHIFTNHQCYDVIDTPLGIAARETATHLAHLIDAVRGIVATTDDQVRVGVLKMG